MRFLAGIVVAILFITACQSNVSYSEFVSLQNGWHKDNRIAFDYQPTDTISKNNVFIVVRNDEKYPFSNLFLITRMEMPNNEVVVDTLEYEMATPEGKWLGQGFSAVKESKLWFKENVAFPVKGNYRFEVEQAMRKVGNPDGIVVLEGITELGIIIEKQ
ncbi:gliding motility lipoprotein GldH [Capnocytophaga canimorsus]|uniref:Gliding motility lipoprotein gldH homolog n=2 Tax=Capnocytophaga canimorsus TaxID=28188 RepID=F9YPY4_CAPCC|nr:gliding motility lipoprotein GldH [Capnocytophaga canimorsus]AEK22229.1 Gliding motility lipoprotein gldH homolog [Capnocytophaga canimorsus Cc5]ATA77451.1 gliding motility lipoprotein GldH [Capnocytophaga canimorsus]ATA94198.1 gliding motility lipoprotein GldH [Capnocytophaga canimorsus]PJI82424.1 gliding motility-associated lipoprotein GldH [Capnocytophaga canimorsus]CEN38940.1 Gliding motility lipoprotein GldH homolog [Capnocytophaga canimorsus]